MTPYESINPAHALHSITIDLSLSLFPGAPFRSTSVHSKRLVDIDIVARRRAK